MEKEMKELKHPFIESAGSLGASFGISKVVTQLYALLYLSSEPLSLDDMSEMLNISKGNTCTNIRYLEQWDAVKKIWVKGTRKDYYEANRDILKIVKNRLKEGLNRRLGAFIAQLDEIETRINNNGRISKESMEAFKSRITEIKKINDFVNKAIMLSETFMK